MWHDATVMQRTHYTDAQRREACELGREHGNAEASRRTGIPAGTIASWRNRAGDASLQTERTRAAVAANRQKWEERRSDLVHRIGEVAEKALDVVEQALDDGATRKASDASATLARLVDKAQLLSGGSTARIGSDADRERVLSEAHERAHLSAVA